MHTHQQGLKQKNTICLVHARTQKQKIKSPSYKDIFLLLLFSLISFSHMTAEPNIGPLVNCDATTFKGIYSLPAPRDCMSDLSKASISTFKADVYNYRKKSTPIYLYQCILRKISLTCSENFFFSKEEKPSSIFIRVNKTLCTTAVKTKESHFGRLVRKTLDSWQTTHKHIYSCACLEQRLFLILN